MASEIKYTFFQYDHRKLGILNCACIGTFPIYDYSNGGVIAYSFTKRKKKVAIWRVKYLKENTSRKTLINEVQNIAA